MDFNSKRFKAIQKSAKTLTELDCFVLKKIAECSKETGLEAEVLLESFIAGLSRTASKDLLKSLV